MIDDRLYLTHILECLEKIEQYAATGRDAFNADPMRQDAIIRNFEIIGEATKRLSEEVRSARPDVSWREVAGFRDVLIHDYLGVDLNQVWNIIQNDMPALKDAVTELLDA
jgi:uncharacterized protein with HEPN domain